MALLISKLFSLQGLYGWMWGGGGIRKVTLRPVPYKQQVRYINSYLFFDWKASLMRPVSILEGEGVDHHFLLVKTYEKRENNV